MKTDDAVAILSRLGEKGILGEPALTEINRDIFDFLPGYFEEEESKIEEQK